MSLGLQLILSTSLVATPPACSWAHPGANPYRGDPVAALADFGMPDSTRARLRDLMARHQPTDVALITRDDIVGTHGYTDLRDMHSGHGKVCHGAVDRSAWSPQRQERGLVYCADDTCVIVPTICNNVSLVSRRPDRVAGPDEEPIDIEPAAGPRPAPDVEPAQVADATSPGDFVAPLDGIAGIAPGSDGDDGGGFGGGVPPAAGFPGLGGEPGPISSVPPVTPGLPGGGGGGGGGDVPPPLSPVPEAPSAWLLAAGLAGLAFRRLRRASRTAGRAGPATR